jgi:ParB family chromosome partitioning protein
MKTSTTLCIALDKLEPLPGNREFGTGLDAKSLKELAASITEYGVRTDFEVQPHPDKKDHYQIFAGVRRLVAAQRAGLKEVPCKVSEATDSEAQELRLIENVQRVGVQEIEESRGYQALLELKDAGNNPLHTRESIATKNGKSVAYVYSRLQML